MLAHLALTVLWRRLKLTFHDALTPSMTRLFRTMGYKVMRINYEHTVISNSKQKVDIYRDTKKSWNLIGEGMTVNVVNQADMAAMVIKNLEKIQ